MIVEKLPPLVVDADPWLRRLCLPSWALGKLREMRVGEVLLLTEFEAPGLTGSDGVAGVAVTRMEAYYELESIWTANLGRNASRRPHLWWAVQFKLKPGRKLELLQREFAGSDFRLAGLRQAALVQRRARLLARWARRAGAVKAAVALEPANFWARTCVDDAALDWLETLRGPLADPLIPAQHTE